MYIAWTQSIPLSELLLGKNGRCNTMKLHMGFYILHYQLHFYIFINHKKRKKKHAIKVKSETISFIFSHCPCICFLPSVFPHDLSVPLLCTLFYMLCWTHIYAVHVYTYITGLRLHMMENLLFLSFWGLLFLITIHSKYIHFPRIVFSFFFGDE